MRKEKRVDFFGLFILTVYFLGLVFIGDPLFELQQMEGEISMEKIKAPENLWKGIIGEAVSEGFCGMYAVACCYRNRIAKGLPLGCVALKRKDLDEFIEREAGVGASSMAQGIIKAVFEFEGKDITNGSTHYENIEKYGEPYWVKGMEIVAKIGCHTFYRGKRENESQNNENPGKTI